VLGVRCRFCINTFKDGQSFRKNDLQGAKARGPITKFKREGGLKVKAGSQQCRPPLFIGGETQRSKFFNSTVKNDGVLVIHAEVSGTDAVEDVFFCLDSRSLGFDRSGLRQSKRFAIEGLLLGDSESGLSYAKS
jgi:hypothetical protein